MSSIKSIAPIHADLESPIYVTQPYLPPLAEFIPYLTKIWNSRVLTNGGPFHQQLESALCDYLGVQHISLFTNGTLALVTAMQAAPHASHRGVAPPVAASRKAAVAARRL